MAGIAVAGWCEGTELRLAPDGGGSECRGEAQPGRLPYGWAPTNSVWGSREIESYPSL